jgi:hypothetical protein
VCINDVIHIAVRNRFLADLNIMNGGTCTDSGCGQELNHTEDPEDGMFWMDKEEAFKYLLAPA